jgi:hypothetical protein
MRSILLALPFALIVGGAAVADVPLVKVALLPQHGSRIGGTAAITHLSVKPAVVDVRIVLDGVFIPENEYPAGIYAGTCSKMGADPAYQLNPVVGGSSDTRLRGVAPKSGSYVVAVFNTMGTQTMSCGALPRMKHQP